MAEADAFTAEVRVERTKAVSRPRAESSSKGGTGQEDREEVACVSPGPTYLSPGPLVESWTSCCHPRAQSSPSLPRPSGHCSDTLHLTGGRDVHGVTSPSAAGHRWSVLLLRRGPAWCTSRSHMHHAPLTCTPLQTFRPGQRDGGLHRLVSLAVSHRRCKLRPRVSVTHPEDSGLWKPQFSHQEGH